MIRCCSLFPIASFSTISWRIAVSFFLRHRFPIHFLRRQLVGCAIGILCLTGSMVSAQENEKPGDRKVDFNRDIKPIFSDRCYQCHGPDKGSRKAGFRLDDPKSAIGKADSGERPIVPGDPDSSEIMFRITADEGEGDLMPPESSHKPRLTDREVAKIRTWIQEGAEFEEHWAFVAPIRPEIPKRTSEWGTDTIDRFVAAKMFENGLTPSAPATRSKLIRRLTLDLTGLPPTPAETKAFVDDPDENAYEKVVDRLLASPRYGEHMARYWLDAVRYADTHGLHFDNYREIWPYRDWVIRAFNENLDWARFTEMQIAGDLLSNPTREDLIASGYNRLHVTTNEGGSILEEVYVRNVVDRVATTGTVFLGLSVGCAQCHDHKFDPISARDFYSLFAFFNNLDANPMDGNAKSHAPVLQISTPEVQAALAAVDRKIESLNNSASTTSAELKGTVAAWTKKWEQRLAMMWNPLTPLTAKSTHGATLSIDPQRQTITASGSNPEQETYEVVFKTEDTGLTALKLDALVGESGFSGRSSIGNSILTEIQAEIRPATGDAPYRPLEFKSATAGYSRDDYQVGRAIDKQFHKTLGWGIGSTAINRNQSAIFSTDRPFGFDGGTLIRVRLFFNSEHEQHSFGKFRISATNEGSMATHRVSEWKQLGPLEMSPGQKAYRHDFGPETNVDLEKTYLIGKKKHSWEPRPKWVDGKVHLFPQATTGATYLYREIDSPDERLMTLHLGSDDAIRVWLNEKIVHEKNVARGVAANQDRVLLTLRPGTNRLLLKIVNFGGATGFYYSAPAVVSTAPDAGLQDILRVPAAERTGTQKNSLVDHLRQFDESLRKIKFEVDALRQEKVKIAAKTPTTLIMKERKQIKPAYLLKRGSYDQPDKELGPLPRAVPGFLPPLSKDAPQNRLGLARWLTAKENPLMARVTVNRFWQQFFGSGIVATSDDFGSQGSPPSHPELLDWLAIEFRESGWNVKKLVKRIVMSDTYCQDSTLTAERLKRDPKNVWLSRGPRYRLDAEVLRDQALAVSGLLHHQLGGQGVKPPQPAGIWKAVGYVGSNTSVFKADQGKEKVHRRSIYTFWKRTAPPPQMSIFDAPTREECVIRRERTNNPLQALALLNDPQYFEAARHLAERIVQDAALKSPVERAKQMFFLATQRSPRIDEIQVLETTFREQKAVFEKDAVAAKTLLQVGAFPPPQSIEPAELAAWTVVANVILNLDEVISKQ